MKPRVAWINDQWMARESVGLALDDWGFLQGVVLVERLRTCNQHPLDVQQHVDRLLASCSYVRIDVSGIPWIDLVHQCADRNLACYPGQDFSLVLLVTPGRCSDRAQQPTVIIHTASIDTHTLARWYEHGEHLRTADTRNVPSECWSPRIKTRARLHYYLASRQTIATGGGLSDPHDGDVDCGTILADLDGNLTETSNANIMIIGPDQGIILPPRDSVLEGISLQRTLRLANNAGYSIRFEPISPEVTASASEMLLTGSTGCIWPVASLNERRFSSPADAPVYRHLAQLWRDDIHFDFTQLSSF